MQKLESAQTRRSGRRHIAALALGTALLLALATGGAQRLAHAPGPAARGPESERVATDGYAPTRLDYREDHRSARAEEQPARADYQAQHEGLSPTTPNRSVPPPQRLAQIDALFYGPAAAHSFDQPRQRQQPARLDATFYGQSAPAAGAGDPRASQQQQRPAWLDALYYGPDDGAPPQDGTRYRGLR